MIVPSLWSLGGIRATTLLCLLAQVVSLVAMLHLRLSAQPPLASGASTRKQAASTGANGAASAAGSPDTLAIEPAAQGVELTPVPAGV